MVHLLVECLMHVTLPTLKLSRHKRIVYKLLFILSFSICEFGRNDELRSCLICWTLIMESYLLTLVCLFFCDIDNVDNLRIETLCFFNLLINEYWYLWLLPFNIIRPFFSASSGLLSLWERDLLLESLNSKLGINFIVSSISEFQLEKSENFLIFVTSFLLFLWFLLFYWWLHLLTKILCAIELWVKWSWFITFLSTILFIAEFERCLWGRLRSLVNWISKLVLLNKLGYGTLVSLLFSFIIRLTSTSILSLTLGFLIFWIVSWKVSALSLLRISSASEPHGLEWFLNVMPLSSWNHCLWYGWK